MKRNIAILGTLDTKGAEVAYMKGLVEARGHFAILIDVGPVGPPGVEPDIANEEVARLIGYELSSLLQTGERDRIMEAMGEGAGRSLLNLLREGRLDGVIGIGGNQGSAITSMAMKVLPLGFPKFLVSTVASGDIRPYIGHKDIGVMFSVGDLVGGPNPVTRSVLANAVSGLLGMVEGGKRISLRQGERTIAVTALGNTEPAVSRATRLLRQRGFEVVAFHASGAGGSAMEELIEGGFINAVLDLTPHEVTEEVVGAGAYVPVRPGRLSAAGLMGIPQVISTGALEYVCFGPRESIPPGMRRRKIYMHNPYNANMRVSREEMAQVGRVMAERLNQASGPTAVLVPRKGWSVYGREGGPLHNPRGNKILLKALKRNLKRHIQYEEIDAHINDPQFADVCVGVLADLVKGLVYEERRR
jgi:uncharacterized protein (UPF0261 family)